MISLKNHRVDFNLTQSAGRAELHVAPSAPANAVIGVPVGTSGAVPPALGIDRRTLQAMGFEGKAGQALVVPGSGGAVKIAVGLGDPSNFDVAGLRDIAAAFARAGSKHTHLATDLGTVAGIEPEVAAQVVVEGALLARYSYDELKRKPGGALLSDLTLIADARRHNAVVKGAKRGKHYAEAAMLARDLANAPPAYLTASRMGDVAEAIAGNASLSAELFDKKALERLGCGGLLGVNAGSTEPPRMVKLTYRPGGNARAAKTAGHLAMVGKGVMYDSGGISLKPSDGVHATMKQDMSGAGAILAAMSQLEALDCKTTVTGYLMCTDNMPSGSATKLGDVLTIRGGTTVEVLNTDAEGRLILADGLVLANELKPDAIVDIATLTGACLRALGPSTAGVFGNNANLIGQASAAARNTDEQVWELPLDHRYRRELDSDIADMKNMGGANGGAIHAALFLEEFIGDTPWVHLDIAGPVLAEGDESWRPKGATGFGARLLLDMALNFSKPAS